MHSTPFVSVVVPVKNRPLATKRLIESFIKQSYPADRRELIIVGDVNDSTWEAISEYLPHIVAIEATVISEGRDANAKRNIGLGQARGDILALTDSDIVLPEDWIQKGVNLLGQGKTDNYQVIAGGLMSIGEDNFLADYIDLNPVGSKTSRMNPPYLLTWKNSGRGRFKPPITANMFFTRAVYRAVKGLDADFVTPYEDYPFADNILKAGYSIYCTTILDAYHEHRTSPPDLLNEYWNAGIGCADYILKYGQSYLAKARAVQLLIIMIAIPAWLISFMVMPVAVLAITATLGIVLSLTITIIVGRISAIWYLSITVILILLFALGMSYGFANRKIKQQLPTQISYQGNLKFGN